MVDAKGGLEALGGFGALPLDDAGVVDQQVDRLTAERVSPC
jgi:hypothetical protein